MEATNTLLRLPNGEVAQGNVDNEPLWCSAKHIGLQIPHIHSSVEDITPGGQEDTQAFFDRLTQCDNAQSIRMKMDVSMKPIKAESLAVNSLKNTASANPPPCDRAIEAYQHIVDFAPVTLQFVNLAAELPGVQGILAQTAPRFLLDIYASMNRGTKEALSPTDYQGVIVTKGLYLRDGSQKTYALTRRHVVLLPGKRSGKFNNYRDYRHSIYENAVMVMQPTDEVYD
ncbi:uncharacterized protein FIESC28_02282 [Fusarium coffeatum]|uniref:Uncharacterized protein n=1 Tax=Fusarium coffeatum TaxID=231269 RepID=A0A366S7Q6_9HYPO|nr:uncharacterized protein FIESC28_02282 [Fusarium coffeatum]RBR25012.1 hypothetical protein FIESC28_02282 [Fusarium coffeatum]